MEADPTTLSIENMMQEPVDTSPRQAGTVFGTKEELKGEQFAERLRQQALGMHTNDTALSARFFFASFGHQGDLGYSVRRCSGGTHADSCAHLGQRD